MDNIASDYGNTSFGNVLDDDDESMLEEEINAKTFWQVQPGSGDNDDGVTVSSDESSMSSSYTSALTSLYSTSNSFLEADDDGKLSNEGLSFDGGTGEGLARFHRKEGPKTSSPPPLTVVIHHSQDAPSSPAKKVESPSTQISSSQQRTSKKDGDNNDDPMHTLAECMKKTALSRALIEKYCQASLERFQDRPKGTTKQQQPLQRSSSMKLQRPSSMKVKPSLPRRKSRESLLAASLPRRKSKESLVAASLPRRKSRESLVAASSLPRRKSRESFVKYPISKQIQSSLQEKKNQFFFGEQYSSEGSQMKKEPTSSLTTTTTNTSTKPNFRLTGLKFGSSEKLKRLDAKLQMLNSSTPQKDGGYGERLLSSTSAPSLNVNMRMMTMTATANPVRPPSGSDVTMIPTTSTNNEVHVQPDFNDFFSMVPQQQQQSPFQNSAW